MDDEGATAAAVLLNELAVLGLSIAEGHCTAAQECFSKDYFVDTRPTLSDILTISRARADAAKKVALMHVNVAVSTEARAIHKNP